jgi:hypothetical protein
MSNTYTPDTWVVLKITNLEDATFCYKVLGGWYGGYCKGDSWQLNSGIASTIKTDSHYEFTGYSGSVYTCYFTCNKLSTFTASVLESFTTDLKGKATIKVLTEDEIASLI